MKSLLGVISKNWEKKLSNKVIIQSSVSSCAAMKLDMMTVLIIIGPFTIALALTNQLYRNSPNGFSEQTLHLIDSVGENVTTQMNISENLHKYQIDRPRRIKSMASTIKRTLHFAGITAHTYLRHRSTANLYNKVQKRFPQTMPFPCITTEGRSKERPVSVHRVRPGDIDLIACLGDSAAKGYGNMASNIFQIFVADHDVSMLTGGRDTWREYITLPNILKEFNPNLVGYATTPAIEYPRKNDDPDYDFSDPGAVAMDTLVQAEEFVRKMNSDPRVNVQQDWKLISIFVGGLDICTIGCRGEEDPLERVRKDMEQALDYLMKHSPRTIVNIVVTPNVIRYFQAQKDLTPICEIFQRIICMCFFFKKPSSQEQYALQMDNLPKTLLKTAKNPKYQQKQDFAIVAQPFFVDTRLPIIHRASAGATTDFTYYSPDCAHTSQKFQARASIALWNSLLTPPDEKSYSINFNENLLETFACPTAERPFLATIQNSQ